MQSTGVVNRNCNNYLTEQDVNRAGCYGSRMRTFHFDALTMFSH